VSVVANNYINGSAKIATGYLPITAITGVIPCRNRARPRRRGSRLDRAQEMYGLHMAAPCFVEGAAGIEIALVGRQVRGPDPRRGDILNEFPAHNRNGRLRRASEVRGVIIAGL